MFHSARIKLTLWYCLIIMVICGMFSVVIFAAATEEINRVEHVQRLRIEGRLRNFPIQLEMINPELIEESRSRILWTLILIDTGILIFSGVLGYFLAGKTLRPIKEMVDEQTRFISDASHELRTPLTALKSEIEVNLRDKTLTLKDARKLLGSNLEEVNNLQILSDGLIKLTRYQKGSNNLAVSNLSIKEIATEAMKKLSSLAKAKKISIVENTPSIKIEGDKALLTELLVIFLDNAIKYSPAGSKIFIDSHKTDSHVAISIKDLGAGISEEDIPHLFDRFYRSDKSRNKTDVQGYGLGLSIAKQIIERHNGSVQVQSEINRGTTFTIALPLKHRKDA